MPDQPIDEQREEQLRGDPKTENEPLSDSQPRNREDLPSANELLGTLFEEPGLWPLLSVLLASLGAMGAGLLVLVFADHNPFAAAALVLLLGMTTDVLVRARKNPGLRSLAKLVALFWGSASLLAAVAFASGIV